MEFGRYSCFFRVKNLIRPCYFTSQIELDLKNDVMAHVSSLKELKNKLFKTDFTWASKQFKELKSANTLLIANDGILSLINDNTFKIQRKPY
jgi:hypothetical protein